MGEKLGTIIAAGGPMAYRIRRDYPARERGPAASLLPSASAS
jgi:hypothetical protein